MESDVSGQVIGAAIEVHRALGPGLLESVYQACLCRELTVREVPFRCQVLVPLDYKGVKLDCAYRADLIVSDLLVVEIKSVAGIERVHQAQLLTYMKLGGRHLGLLLNFNVPVLKEGIRRLIL